MKAVRKMTVEEQKNYHMKRVVTLFNKLAKVWRLKTGGFYNRHGRSLYRQFAKAIRYHENRLKALGE